MSRFPTIPTSKLTIAAVLTAFALTLTACGGGGGDSTATSPAPKPKAQWGDWTTLPYAASTVASVGDRTVVLDESADKLRVIDASGKKQWDVPGGVGRDGKPRVAAGPKALYAVGTDAGVRALDWKDGHELWTFNADTISECIGTSSVGVTTGSGGTYLAKDDRLVMTVSQTVADQQQYDYDPNEEIPARCTESNAGMPSVPTLVALDPGSGKATWQGSKISLVNEVYPAQSDPTGRYIFQVSSHRGSPDVSRTEVATGKTATTGPLQLMDKGFTREDGLNLTPYSTDGFALEWGGADVATGGTKYDAQVASWKKAGEAGNGGAATRVKLTKLTDSDKCKNYVHRGLTSGVSYCFALLQPGKFQVAEVGKNGPQTPWTLQADKAINDWSGKNTYGDDPIIDRDGGKIPGLSDGKGPLIAVATSGGSLSAMELGNGKEAWRWTPGGAQTGVASGGASAGASDGTGDDPTEGVPAVDDGEEAEAPASFPNNVPSTGQVVFTSAGSIVGVDAATGKTAWQKQAAGSADELDKLTATDGALAAQVGGEDGKTLVRFAQER